MSVYVDNARLQFGRMKMSHMIADTAEELHSMAERIGLKREWFQGHTVPPHYDVSYSVRRVALQNGAIPVSAKEFFALMQKFRVQAHEQS